jgi:adenosylmethionine-8-amino-7-oxononanoate aminotransferase
VALANLDLIEREGLLANVLAHEDSFGSALDDLRDIPIVGDVRGAGHFWAIELVRDQATRESFDGPAADWLLKDVLSEELWQRGLICRLDDRAEPIVQIAPPLVASAELIEEIAAILRAGLETAIERMREHPELAGVA